MFLEEVTVSVLSERRVFSGYGLKGGENGAVGLNIFINHDKVRKNIGGKNSFKVGLFETVRIETPGGGGYGVTD
jgi:5-oxoprolinase (ATP-hydrolysing)